MGRFILFGGFLYYLHAYFIIYIAGGFMIILAISAFAIFVYFLTLFLQYYEEKHLD